MPTGYGKQQIWLRGKRNLEAVFAALAADHGLAKAKRIIISGNSAGGLTVYLHLDQIAAMLKTLAPQAKVYGFPDGVSAVGAAGAGVVDACTRAVCTLAAAGAPTDPSTRRATSWISPIRKEFTRTKPRWRPRLRCPTAAAASTRPVERQNWRLKATRRTACGLSTWRRCSRRRSLRSRQLSKLLLCAPVVVLSLL